MTAYHLTLPKGTITKSHGEMYHGSHTTAVWAPYNPLTVGGWKKGDTVEIMCTFNLEPDNLDKKDWPPAKNYNGLCVGACMASDKAAVTQLIASAKRLALGNKGQLIGSHITKANKKSYNDIFYNAQLTILPNIELNPSNRGTLTGLVYEWTLTYNDEQDVASPKDIELVFGYGDPMAAEVMT